MTKDTRTLSQIRRQLNATGATLLLRTADGSIVECHGRGVSDLFRLLNDSPEKLRQATVADKVIGKGAAAIMALGGIAAYTTPVASDAAVRILKNAGIEGRADTIVPSIQNRAKTGRCPLEQRLDGLDDIRDMLPAIAKFVAEMAAKRP